MHFIFTKIISASLVTTGLPALPLCVMDALVGLLPTKKKSPTPLTKIILRVLANDAGLTRKEIEDLSQNSDKTTWLTLHFSNLISGDKDSKLTNMKPTNNIQSLVNYLHTPEKSFQEFLRRYNGMGFPKTEAPSDHKNQSFSRINPVNKREKTPPKKRRKMAKSTRPKPAASKEEMQALHTQQEKMRRDELQDRLDLLAAELPPNPNIKRTLPETLLDASQYIQKLQAEEAALTKQLGDLKKQKAQLTGSSPSASMTTTPPVRFSPDLSCYEGSLDPEELPLDLEELPPDPSTPIQRSGSSEYPSSPSTPPSKRLSEKFMLVQGSPSPTPEQNPPVKHHSPAQGSKRTYSERETPPPNAHP